MAGSLPLCHGLEVRLVVRAPSRGVGGARKDGGLNLR